jgi:hypothetical protein
LGYDKKLFVETKHIQRFEVIKMLHCRTIFRFSPLAAALGLAFVAGQAYAATLTSANVPVNGTVVVGAVAGPATPSAGDFGGTGPATGTLTLTVGSTLAVVT